MITPLAVHIRNSTFERDPIEPMPSVSPIRGILTSILYVIALWIGVGVVVAAFFGWGS